MYLSTIKGAFQKSKTLSLLNSNIEKSSEGNVFLVGKKKTHKNKTIFKAQMAFFFLNAAQGDT